MIISRLIYEFLRSSGSVVLSLTILILMVNYLLRFLSAAFDIDRDHFFFFAAFLYFRLQTRISKRTFENRNFECIIRNLFNEW